MMSFYRTIFVFAIVALSKHQLVFARIGDILLDNITNELPADQRSYTSSGEKNSSYVFLQKFPLEGSNGLFFHTEVLVCPKEHFSQNDRKTLDDQVSSLTYFTELEESWWTSRTASCVELGYGGAACSQRCCGVPHNTGTTSFALNERKAVIGNADVQKKTLYLYGTGSFDGEVAYHATCDHKCWSNWAGTDYNPLTNNCNTFTSTVLSCVYGLSEKKPNLGPSDMVNVKCDTKCPAAITSESKVL
mmetsp:Transcript_4874/g.5847  ORF Transcript_4874/g.5847 Transcript_4874/m.5847 type:complete len:246 (-) Transcript_4874:608-1345(-)|eukprot:CAMPEP_0195310748 /NCGR_PEP_ID=MMETSP0708-20121125/229_1 /TAXON_ID=33640 /ORGANISM="Asterionellopsis glacialis, Strain CCMP134" /LENGTH=245 /DNA_ID=CAMNT_0040375099 /DNA_START=9 /DNA_END=746 /DNA_ORIENTATION=+